MSLVLVTLMGVSYAVTGRLDAWLPLSDSAGHMEASERSMASETPIGPERVEAAGTSIAGGEEALHEHSASSGNGTSNRSAEGTNDGNDHHATTTVTGSASGDGDESPDTTAPHDHVHPTPAPSPTVQGEITGDACPCTVTNAAELKGTVNLKGDLVVMGGTLVARPGVTVNGNGFQILFTQGGKADFQGSATSTWSGNGSSANLSRDLNFKDLRRIMFVDGASRSTLRYFTVSGSGGAALGDYPIHFHMNGNSTRGTLVEGVVVVASSHHAFVPHGSHGITFKDTIAKDVKGAAYWWDPGQGGNCSNDILYDHALADHVVNAPGDNRGFYLEAFRLGCGSGNVVRNSVARNVAPSHPNSCSGYHWPENDEGVWGFVNNASYGSACNGIFVWQNTSKHHLVDGFSGDGIENGAYVNQYVYRSLDISFIKAHALGRDGQPVVFENGRVGSILITNHTLGGEPIIFRNLEIGAFIIDNAGGTVPGTYILDGTNLSCGDIEYRSVYSGSRVIVNGTSC
ncbi:MAG TPA: hypothetical protein VJ950_09460 [Acidimicrobiia bacterium]|nr:hypothetical protein [Acidimicrobiia bacterium]